MMANQEETGNNRQKQFLSFSADAATLASALQQHKRPQHAKHNLSQSCFALFKSNGGDDDLTNLNWLQSTSLINNIPTVLATGNHGYRASLSGHSNKRNHHGHFRSKSAPTSSTSSLRSTVTAAAAHKRVSLGNHNNKHVDNDDNKYDSCHDINCKPPYSFPSLIFMAIENSSRKMLPVKDIYTWVLEHFPYFKSAPTGWKNSVRHNLSLNKCFKKVDREKGQAVGKGSLWCVDQEYRPNLLQTLKKTSYMTFKRQAGNINLGNESQSSLIKGCEGEEMNLNNDTEAVQKSETLSESQSENVSDQSKNHLSSTDSHDHSEKNQSDAVTNNKSLAPGLVSLAAAGAIVNVPGKKSISTVSNDTGKQLKTEDNEMTEVDDGFIESDVLNNSFTADEDESNTNKGSSLCDSGYAADDVNIDLSTSNSSLPHKKKLKTCKDPVEMDSYAGAGALLDLASSAPKPLKV